MIASKDPKKLANKSYLLNVRVVINSWCNSFSNPKVKTKSRVDTSGYFLNKYILP